MKNNKQMELNFRKIRQSSGDAKKVKNALRKVDSDRQNFDLSKYLTNHSLNMACDPKSQAWFFGNRIHKLLSTREASGLLGVSENALRILVFRRRVKAYKLGNRLRFKLGDLMDCLQQKEV